MIARLRAFNQINKVAVQNHQLWKFCSTQKGIKLSKPILSGKRKLNKISKKILFKNPRYLHLNEISSRVQFPFSCFRNSSLIRKGKNKSLKQNLKIFSGNLFGKIFTNSFSNQILLPKNQVIKYFINLASLKVHKV